MIKLLANTAGFAATQIKVTNTSDADLTAADNLGIEIIKGGPRHLSHSPGTSARRYVYLNKTDLLTFDSFVLTRADRHVGHYFQLSWYDPYPASQTFLVSESAWAPSLVGPRAQDYVYTGSAVVGAEAIAFDHSDGGGGSYTKYISQGYFCTSLDLEQHSPLVLSPAWTKVNLGKQLYSIQETIRFQVEQLSRADIDRLENECRLHDEPFFLYDSSGYWLTDKLAHCVLMRLSVTPQYDNLFVLSLEVGRLRDYAA